MQQKTLCKDWCWGKLLLGALYTSIAVAVVATAMLAVSPESKLAEVVIAGKTLSVIVADTEATQAKGLSGRKSLKPNEGMLFIFPKPGFYEFWMKDMKIPIDIIWFDVERSVVDVWENAIPDSYPRVYTPRAEAKYVLEVEAGFFAEHLMKAGDILELK